MVNQFQFNIYLNTLEFNSVPSEILQRMLLKDSQFFFYGLTKCKIGKTNIYITTYKVYKHKLKSAKSG